MINQPIKISENCWKHSDQYGIVYRKTSDPNSTYHREDGPALEYSDGTKCWYINGERHRTDGPAIEYSDDTNVWYFHGKRIDVNSQEEFEIYIKNLIFI